MGQGSGQPPNIPRCDHRGIEPVKVGSYEVHAGGTSYLRPGDLAEFDIIVPLDDRTAPPWGLGVRYDVLGGPIEDFQPPPPEYRQFLEEVLIPEIEAGKKVLMFCIGSHGRTGTVLAGLIALLESEARDPIAVTRSRHCHKAVETRQQAEWVFSLRGQELPRKWQRIRSVPVRSGALTGAH